MKLKKLGLFRKLPNRFFVSKAKEAESGGSSSVETLTLDFNNSNTITLTDEQIDILLNTNPLVVGIKNFKNSAFDGDSAAIKTNVVNGSSHYLITFNRFFSWFAQSSGSTWYGNNSVKQCVEQLQINKTTKEAALMPVAHMNIPNLDKEKFDELYAPVLYRHNIEFRETVNSGIYQLEIINHTNTKIENYSDLINVITNDYHGWINFKSIHCKKVSNTSIKLIGGLYTLESTKYYTGVQIELQNGEFNIATDVAILKTFSQPYSITDTVIKI